jgi:hypothetical protein
MGEVPRCCAEVWPAGAWRFSRCSRVGVVEEGGKFYCRQHAPSAAAARREARGKKWRLEKASRDAGYAVETAKEGIVACVRAATEQLGSWDDVADAMDKLRQAEAALLEARRALDA